MGQSFHNQCTIVLQPWKHWCSHVITQLATVVVELEIWQSVLLVSQRALRKISHARAHSLRGAAAPPPSSPSLLLRRIRPPLPFTNHLTEDDSCPAVLCGERGLTVPLTPSRYVSQLLWGLYWKVVFRRGVMCSTVILAPRWCLWYSQYPLVWHPCALCSPPCVSSNIFFDDGYFLSFAGSGQ